MTHRDLAKARQPHGERRGHEVLEGQVEALLIEAQRAVQRLLYRAPHQVGHVAGGALPQLLVRQLAQVPAGGRGGELRQDIMGCHHDRSMIYFAGMTRLWKCWLLSTPVKKNVVCFALNLYLNNCVIV